ncbi:AEC family transporter [uncultured Oscillibacter sp.]|uniref:AEC family transporter n=1 Tax=uncultured Oscillibacter sp. TaxID=876091 RepID=UPI0035A66406
MFSLNATVPVFSMMVLGYLLHNKTRLLDSRFADCLNTFVFQVALPVQLFQNLATSDFHTIWNGGVVVFCFVTSLLSILLLLGLSFLLRETGLRAEFIQAGYRGSQALLGTALMQNIYGSSGPLALVLIGAVPLYNVAAVLLLTLMVPGGRLDRKALGKAAKGIVTNPIILGIAVGLLWSLLKIPQPVILQRSVSSLAATATPLGLLALGASIEPRKVLGCWKPTVVSSVFKLLVFGALFLPVAIHLGYRGEVLVVILIMLASPATVSCFNMARSMGHEGTLSAGTVVLTTVCSAFTFTLWLYILRTLALI